MLRLDDERALVLTTDFFTPIVDDARDWGRIAAANALSDVYAMGGRPLMALNLTAWPAADLPVELLAEVLRGGAEVAGQAGCPVVGGHSIDDPEPKYGLAVVGMADPGRLLTNARARPGDRLVLTKPLGTGVVATAVKRGHPDPADVAAAVAAMTTLNRDAAEAALAAGVEAATDVTGFGLLGHLHRMLRASGVGRGGRRRPGCRSCPARPSWPRPASSPAAPAATRRTCATTSTGAGPAPGGGHPAPRRPDLGRACCWRSAAERLGGLVGDLRGRRDDAAVIGRVVDGRPGRIGVRRMPLG